MMIIARDPAPLRQVWIASFQVGDPLTPRSPIAIIFMPRGDHTLRTG